MARAFVKSRGKLESDSVGSGGPEGPNWLSVAVHRPNHSAYDSRRTGTQVIKHEPVGCVAEEGRMDKGEIDVDCQIVKAGGSISISTRATLQLQSGRRCTSMQSGSGRPFEDVFIKSAPFSLSHTAGR